MQQQLQYKLGFSLVEMIVALAVFAVVITISIGALLMLIATNQQLQAKQSVMTNLSFALDSMTREIRTGTSYFCASVSNTGAATPVGPGSVKIFDDNGDLTSLKKSTADCKNGNADDSNNKIIGITFIEGGESITGAPEKRIVYFFDGTEVTSSNKKGHKLYRRIDDGPALPITSSGIYIEDAKFYVSGSDPLSSGDVVQPTVTIFIKAKENNSPTAEPYEIQTTVTQRALDI